MDEIALSLPILPVLPRRGATLPAPMPPVLPRLLASGRDSTLEASLAFCLLLMQANDFCRTFKVCTALL